MSELGKLFSKSAKSTLVDANVSTDGFPPQLWMQSLLERKRRKQNIPSCSTDSSGNKKKRKSPLNMSSCTHVCVRQQKIPLLVLLQHNPTSSSFRRQHAHEPTPRSQSRCRRRDHVLLQRPTSHVRGASRRTRPATYRTGSGIAIPPSTQRTTGVRETVIFNSADDTNNNTSSSIIIINTNTKTRALPRSSDEGHLHQQSQQLQPQYILPPYPTPQRQR